MREADRSVSQVNEQHTAAAFTRQSKIFDGLFSGNPIIRYKRQRVRNVLHEHLHPGSRILEINSGTGEDAIWFAQQGHYVHATDISEGMQKVLREKICFEGLQRNITSEKCSYTSLEKLQDQGPYDLIFSNFAGLNCTEELSRVIRSFGRLLQPNGKIVLVLLPPFCLWELLMVFRGRFRTAFRRFFSKQGIPARVEGISITCWYYNPGFIIKQLKSEYNLLGVEGICSIVPPSYIEHFAERYPILYRFLQKKEGQLKSKWPWRSIGDYYIISMQKKD